MEFKSVFKKNEFIFIVEYYFKSFLWLQIYQYQKPLVFAI